MPQSKLKRFCNCSVETVYTITSCLHLLLTYPALGWAQVWDALRLSRHVLREAIGFIIGNSADSSKQRWEYRWQASRVGYVAKRRQNLAI